MINVVNLLFDGVANLSEEMDKVLEFEKKLAKIMRKLNLNEFDSNRNFDFFFRKFGSIYQIFKSLHQSINQT
jgi:phage gpG-like protein